MKFLVRLFVKLTGAIPTWILFRPKIYFEDPNQRIAHLKGRAILISNHTSIMDYFLMLLIFPFRCLHYFVGEFVFKMNKFVSFMNWGMGNINVDRNVADMKYMSTSQKILQKGGVVGIFPEGHFNKKKRLDPFKTSFVHLAALTNTPIIPIYIDPKTFNFFKRTRLIIGKPIYVSEFTSNTQLSEEEAIEIADKFRSKITYLSTLYKNYRKYHTFGYLNFHHFFFDFVKITGFIPNLIGYPIRNLYEDKTTKNKWKIKNNAIVTSNHISFIDPGLMVFANFNRRIRILAAEVLYASNPKIMTHFLNAMNCIRINNEIETGDLAAFNDAINILKSFGVIGIFPEGHIYRNNEETNYKEGVSVLAYLTNSPIYPMIILKRYRLFRRQYIMRGNPIYLKDYLEDNEQLSINTIKRLTNILQTKNKELKELGLKRLESFGKRAYQYHIE